MSKLLVSFLMAFAFMIPNAHAMDYLFIGDSRFVGMEYAISYKSNVVWIAEVGAGSGWYWQNRDNIAGFGKDAIVVYELGINDMYVEGCIEALSDLKNLGFGNVFFVTLAPVNEALEAEYGYTRTNDEIVDFNNAVISNLPAGVSVIDSYSFLMWNGFDTEDGLHYTSDTYDTWFDNIIFSI